MLSTRRERQAAISIDAGVREWRWRERSGQRCDCTDAPLPRTRIHGDLAMNAGHFEQISDCWSSEQQPARYYRTAAARARRLQADATTPRVKQYLDKMMLIVKDWREKPSRVSHPVLTGVHGPDENGEEIVIDSSGSPAELAEKKRWCR